jgi:type VII secretion integral membrane protein EccD
MEEPTQRRTAAPVRLRFVLGQNVTDVAVPAEVALVDVLPAVLPALQPDAADHGTDHDGYVVQRFGEKPLDEEKSAAELDLLDGETVHIRPRAAALPPIDFDDMISGIADQVTNHSDHWNPGRLRGMLLGLAALSILLALPVLGLNGLPLERALASIGLCVVLLTAAGVASRAALDPVVGTIFAGAAAAYAAVAGWAFATYALPDAGWALPVATSAIATLTALCVGLAAVADSALIFTGGITFTIAIGLPALVAAYTGYSQQDIAGITLVISLGVMMGLPLIAFRLGGSSLPMLPGRPDQLNEDIDPVPHQLVVDRGKSAVSYQSALLIGVCLAQAPLGLILVAPGGLWMLLFATMSAALLFLRARHLTTAVQRWAVLVPGTVITIGVLMRWLQDQELLIRAAVAPFMLAIGLAFVVAATIVPGRRLRPYWARAADISEMAIAVAMLPVLGAALGIYTFIRHWAGG